MADQEIDKDVELGEDGQPVVEVELGEDGEPIVEVELDEDGEPIVKELESWQKVEDDGDLPDVPVGTHVKMKQKLKGRIEERDGELDKLRTELDQLKANKAAPTELPPRPKSGDFDTDELYDAAVDEWNDTKLEIKLAAYGDQNKQADASNNTRKAIAANVDSHYERSAQLVEDSGIKAEYFKEADSAVRQSVEAILPKQGDAVTDQIISLLGEGSEKVMYFIGRNKAARTEFQSLLAEDRDGMKLMVFLGRQQERLNNPSKAKSQAPKPAADARGDAVPSPKASALKKKYVKAHSEGKIQEAYNIKKQAKVDKHDVSTW